MLLRWLRRDYCEAQIMEKPRWFQWGYVTKWNSKEPHGWYILIRLPSYVMMPPWSAWDDAEPVMHQRCLVFREKLPFQPGSGWQMTYMPCDS